MFQKKCFLEFSQKCWRKNDCYLVTDSGKYPKSDLWVISQKMATLRQLNHQVCLSFFIFFIFWHIWRFFKVSNCWNLKNQQNISRQVNKSLAQPALNSFLHEILESAKSDMNLFGRTIIPLEPILDYGTLSKKKKKNQKSKTHWFQALRQTIIIYLIKLHQFLFSVL